MVDERPDYLIRLEHEDALLFGMMPDGKMRMCALSRQEWDDWVARVRSHGTADELDIIREVFDEVTAVEPAPVVGSSTGQ